MMGKRMTATEKWEDNWFYSLKPIQKLTWLYMLDKCDCAGVLEFNADIASACIGGRVRREDVLEWFPERAVAVNGSKIWLPKFIEFQYGVGIDGLDEASSVHRGVLKIVDRYGLREVLKGLVTLSQPLPNPSQRVKDKDKDKDKNQDKDKEEKKRFGEFDNVLLTETEYGKLGLRFGDSDRIRAAIDILSNYKESSGKQYKSDYAAICGWVSKELDKREAETHGRNRKAGNVTISDIEATIRRNTASVQ